MGGCAGPRVVDSDVQAFSTLQKVAPPATYRFDRLPSQMANPAAQAQLEAIAQASLARVGMERDDASTRFSVAVDTRVQRLVPHNAFRYDPWFSPWGNPWGTPWGRSYHPHLGFGASWGPPATFMEPPRFEREVHLVMRDLGTQQVVFETRAVNESFGPGDPAVVGALFDAALYGFPQPPQGVRRVRIAVPPATAATSEPSPPPATTAK